MKKLILIYLLLSTVIVSKDFKLYYLNEKLRVHTEDNEIYHNKTDLEGIEIEFKNTYGIMYLQGINSFRDFTQVIAATKRFKTKNDKLAYKAGIGIADGYKKVNIYYHDNGDISKTTLHEMGNLPVCPVAFIGATYNIYDKVSVDINLMGKAVIGNFRIEI